MAGGDRTKLINIGPRVTVSLAAVAAVFFVIALRLWYLQILKGDYFRDRSENNRLQTTFIPPPRGLILDRNGELIVSNRPSFNVEFITEDSPDVSGTIKELALIINEDPEILFQKLKNQSKRRKFEPKLLLKDVTRDTVAKISAAKFRLPGVLVAVVPARDYIYGDMASHLIGYIREITQKQLEQPKYATYMIGDLIGQYGLESRWEEFLQGQRGRQRVIVNARGTRVGELSSESEVSGSTLQLTIDRKVQQAADEALTDKKGAVVAIDPRNGDILAMSSSPRFDPNLFVGEMTTAQWKDLSVDKKLNNRAVQGVYPPGSTFKIFTGIAGLSEGVIGQTNRVFCNGALHFAGRDYKCHKKSGHGSVDFYEALVQSCDVYFYTVGQRLGVDRINEYATKFGLGVKSGIELNDENQGLVPSSEWKRRRFHERWYPGETLSVSIGQGAVSLTPLQIANGVAAVVNGGTLYKPRLIKSVISIDGNKLVDDSNPTVTRKIDLDPKLFTLVKNSLIGVVNDPRGTAKRAQLPKELNVTVGGKTGTAQVAGLHHGTKGHLNDHAWFVGYAPADNPQIVVATVVENGGHGGAVAAPVTQKVMERFFDPDGKLVPKTPEVKPTAQPTEGGD